MIPWRETWGKIQIVGGASLRRAPWIVLFMLLAALLDLVGVALIAPFIGLMVDPTSADQVPEVARGLLGRDPLIALGVVLVVVFAIKAVATFLLQGAISRMSESIRAEVMTRLLDAYQHQPYRLHIEQSSAELVNRVVWHSQAFASGFVGAALRLSADVLVFVALGGLVAYVNSTAFLVLVFVLVAVFVLVIRGIRHHAARVQEHSAMYTAQVIHSVTQALGGLREVRVLGCEPYFLKRLTLAGSGLVEAAARLSVINLVPRHAIEFAMVAFLVMLVYLSRLGGDSGQSLLPLLGLIGAAAVRLMPASTSLLNSITQMRSNAFVVHTLASDLEQQQRPQDALRAVSKPAARFQSLRGENLRFAYSESRGPVFSDLNIEIQAGETVGLAGPSGAGKSTLADLMLGFLDPDQGVIRVNGRDIRESIAEWRAQTAYIPQSAYLIDDSLRRNIALGVDDADIDDARVLQSIRDARLEPLLRQLPDGLATMLGERGVRLSGGQRQRVSIARALYHDRQFLIMDEATSALDGDTEREIVETIRGLSGRTTIVLIAHRESTLAAAHRVIRLERPD